MPTPVDRPHELMTRPSPRERPGLWLGLVGGLALLVGIRVWIPFDEVFRGGQIILAGNDPYWYRYHVEQLLLSDTGLRDLGVLPTQIRTGDVFMIITLWAAASGLGGDAWAAGVVLAWYPVVAAIVTSVLVYVLTVTLTDDRRIGLMAVVILALTPAHAYRTMLGFGDHHAFDYIWLMVTALAVVWLPTVDRSERPWRQPRYWLVAGALGIAVAAQSFAWRGAPLLFVPVAGYALVATLSCVRAGRSPIVENAGILLGLVMAAVLAGGVHLGLGWAPAYRGLAPALLGCFVVGVCVVGEGAYRGGLPWPTVLGGELVVIVAWIAGVWTMLPALTDPLSQSIRLFLGSVLEQRTMEIGETASLLSDPQTPLMLFGLLLVVAVPVMVWTLSELRREHRPAWIAISAYAWYFLVMSVNQLRFSGQLSLFVAIFAAIGVVYLAARMEYVAPLVIFESSSQRIPWNGVSGRLDRNGLQAIGAVILLLGLLVGPGVAVMPATMDQITVDDTTVETANWMAEYSADRGWTYPQNYVFSQWGTNRVYNYVVSGESPPQGYAQRNYREFVSSSDGARWAKELSGDTGFIVIQSTQFEYPADSMQVRLGERYGSAGDGVKGLARYRLVHLSADGTTAVFTVVPGATITGTAPANTSVDVATTVQVGTETFTYRRMVQPSADGNYEVTVPYPGEYQVDSATVSVSESNVTNGETVTVAPE